MTHLEELKAVDVKDAHGLALVVAARHLDAVVDAQHEPREETRVERLAERVARVARLHTHTRQTSRRHDVRAHRND